MTPFQALIAVPTDTVSHKMTSVTVKIVPRTLKAGESSSVPNCRVADVKTPIGKVNPHQPMLNGICSPRVRILIMDEMATISQTNPNPQMVKATLRDENCSVHPPRRCAGNETHGIVPA